MYYSKIPTIWNLIKRAGMGEEVARAFLCACVLYLRDTQDNVARNGATLRFIKGKACFFHKSKGSALIIIRYRFYIYTFVLL
jgi:hypothetical protein